MKDDALLIRSIKESCGTGGGYPVCRYPSCGCDKFPDDVRKAVAPYQERLALAESVLTAALNCSWEEPSLSVLQRQVDAYRSKVSP